MIVEVWDNNGKYIDSMHLDAAPLVDDYVQVGADWYKVWRRFITNGEQLNIQLSQRLSMDSSQMPEF
jgi:hypothetical protein